MRLTSQGENAQRTLRVGSDEGCGIPEASLPLVFEPFYRVDAARSRATGGSGLGLAVVRRLVRMMGGDVTVADNSQGGATFCVALSGIRSSSLRG